MWVKYVTPYDFYIKSKNSNQNIKKTLYIPYGDFDVFKEYTSRNIQNLTDWFEKEYWKPGSWNYYTTESDQFNISIGNRTQGKYYERIYKI